LEQGILSQNGAEPQPDKFTSLATIRFIGGLQSQRSPFAGIDTRSGIKFYGGKPDALIAGSNVEISNRLTLQRRPGLVAYGISNIPSPIFFYDWQLATTTDIVLVIDTATAGGDNHAGTNGAVFNYSPTNSGIYINKSSLSKQTNFFDVVNTMYLGDGIDLFKVVGPNLLTQSNTFGTGAGTSFGIQSPWTDAGIFNLTGNQPDPLGTDTATLISWSTTGSGAYLRQLVAGGEAVLNPTGSGPSTVPNYTPIAYNTFTFSFWLMQEMTYNETVTLTISDQNGIIASEVCLLTSAWQKFQVTATMLSTSTELIVSLTDPTSATYMDIWGAQVEVGGPATTTQITTTKPQGVYLWGIKAPVTAPTFTFMPAVGNTGLPWQPGTVYTPGQTIVDSNGNLEIVTTGGTSGTTQPIWKVAQGGVTTDGIQNSVVQSTSGFILGATLAVPLNTAVTAGNTLFAFIFGDEPGSGSSVSVSDSQSNTWVQVAKTVAGDQNVFLYSVASAAAGATTVTVTFAGPATTGIWMGVAEVFGLSTLDDSATNEARDTTAPEFGTGLLITTAPNDFLISFGTFSNNSNIGVEIGVPPSGWQTIAAQTGIQTRTGSGHFMNTAVVCEFTAIVTDINPQWTITSPGGSNSLTGISAAYKTVVGTLQWTNQGTNGAGLTTVVGYEWYYAYGNSYTGHISNVSPISAPSGAFTGQTVVMTGLTRPMIVGQMPFVPALNNANNPNSFTAALYNTDPQSDLIYVFRNVDGGSFWFQDAVFGNGAAAQAALEAAGYPGLSTAVTYGTGTFTLTDTVTDEDLNNNLYAPIGGLNSLPPAGLKNMDFFANRMWGSVANLLYYSTSADNAQLLGVVENGVPSESWIGTNVIPFNSAITRILATGGGLLVATVTDIWFVTGQNLLTGGFNAQKILIGHGLRSYNAMGVDGSTVYIYTSDREFLSLNPNSGSVEVGYPVGDTFELTYSPVNAYIARHISGSRDNAVYFADGATSWYRLNPNQQGASIAGEQTPVWSPKADFTATIGGIAAIGSIETSAGETHLLVGLPSLNSSGIAQSGPVLVRSLSTFSDLGIPYSWTATVGSIMLATPGKMAEVESITTEMNNLPGQVPFDVVALRLGSAAAYALLAYSGITNTGTSAITGGVIGSFPTASITGFNPPPAVVDNTDAEDAQVAALAAYNYYAALPFISLSGSSADLSVLGNGSSASTYTPGNYSAGTSMDIPTSITLDAQGNPNAMFIFYAGSTLTLHSGQSVLLINGAQAENVIWLVGTSFTSVATSTMNGNILALISITLGGGGLNGRALAGLGGSSGAITIAAATNMSVPTLVPNVGSTQCAVGVLLDEIGGVPEPLAISVNDPPQAFKTVTVLGQRFYLSDGPATIQPVCRHIQITLSGTTVTTQDELLGLTVRGALVPEQV
jgi:hypothetical protein